MGSDLDVRFLGEPRGGRGRTSVGPCAIKRPTKLSLWPPFSPDLLRNSACFMYLLTPVPCEAGEGRVRLCNNAGVSMFVSPGGDAGTDTFAFQQVRAWDSMRGSSHCMHTSARASALLLRQHTQGGYTRLTDFLTKSFGYTIGETGASDSTLLGTLLTRLRRESP
jgi:hypothetical protein